MKILVVSDTHGRMDNVIKYIVENKIKHVIHLGDCVDDAEKIQEKTEVDLYYIRGNCDFYSTSIPEELILSFGNKRIFCTHGHKYGVKYTMDKLKTKAREVEADMALFGHTHVLVMEEIDGIVYFNPGSPSIPRTNKGKTVGILEIEGDQLDYYYEPL